MSNFVTSLIRTYVPIAVGAVLSWLAVRGFELDQNATEGLVIFLTGVLQAAYYFVVRWLETRYPQFGVLLGKAREIKYTDVR